MEISAASLASRIATEGNQKAASIIWLSFAEGDIMAKNMPARRCIRKSDGRGISFYCRHLTYPASHKYNRGFWYFVISFSRPIHGKYMWLFDAFFTIQIIQSNRLVSLALGSNLFSAFPSTRDIQQYIECLENAQALSWV